MIPRPAREQYVIVRDDGAIYSGPVIGAPAPTPRWLPGKALAYIWDAEERDGAERNAAQLRALGFTCAVCPAAEL